MEKLILYFLNNASTAVTVFIVLLAIILLIVDYLGRVGRRKNYLRAVPASAKVIKVSRSIGNGTWGGKIVNITLEVIPTDGAPYQVKNAWCLEPLALPKVKAGDTLAIRIDPKHPKEIYSDEMWAWNVGKQIPLRFGDRVPLFYIRTR